MSAPAAEPQSSTGQALSGPQVVAQLASLDGWKLWGDGDTLFQQFTETRAIRRGILDIGQDTSAPDFGRGTKKD